MPKPLPNYIDRPSPLTHQVWNLQTAFAKRVPDALALIESSGISPDGISSEMLPVLTARAAVAYGYGFSTWDDLVSAYRSQDLVSFETVHRFSKAIISTYLSYSHGDVTPVRNLFDELPEAKRLVDMHMTRFDETPLCAAAIQGNFELADLLLGCGADPNRKSEIWAGGYAPIDYGTDQMADFLISRGAVLTIHAAARLGRISNLRRMIATDPKCVHARGATGQTPLHRAKTVEICAMLLNAGAELETLDYQYSATPAAFSFRNAEKLQYLVGLGANYNIFTACALGDLDLTKSVLERNPEAVNVESGYEYIGEANGAVHDFETGRPLTFARKRKQPELLALLLEHADSVYKLLYYCEFAEEEPAKLLVKRYSKLVSRLTKRQQRLICERAMSLQLDAVRIMLEVGFDIETKDKYGRTPLSIVAWRGEPAGVEFLLRRGASRSTVDLDKLTPLERCIDCSKYSRERRADYPSCVKLLIEAGDPVPAMASGSAAVMELLRSFGAH